MNNGVNNTNNVINTTNNTQQQPVTTNVQPQPTVAPQPIVNQPQQNQTDLGSNVKIAPAQPMYDEAGKIIEQNQQETTPPQPVINQPTPPKPGEPPQIQMRLEGTNQEETPENQIEQTEINKEVPTSTENTKKRINLTPLLLIVIIALIGVTIYKTQDSKKTIEQLQYNNMAINTEDKPIELNINSTIVQDLYNKVSTTVKEDIANPNLNDEMKRYLAFRQINPNKIYPSNCNLFDNNKIYYYTCDERSFKPNAFKEETLQLEIKKLFGENTQIDHGNIQLGRHCLGGYEYIVERGEYVQGKCTTNGAVTIKADKNIVKATRINDEILIEEETKYISENVSQIPEALKSGIYTYRFKLDTNFNYAYISKDFRTKY